MFFCVCLDDYFVLSQLVLLGLVCSVPSQEIGWVECLGNDPFFVKWDEKQSVNCWLGLGFCN